MTIERYEIVCPHCIKAKRAFPHKFTLASYNWLRLKCPECNRYIYREDVRKQLKEAGVPKLKKKDKRFLLPVEVCQILENANTSPSNYVIRSVMEYHNNNGGGSDE